MVIGIGEVLVGGSAASMVGNSSDDADSSDRPPLAMQPISPRKSMNAMAPSRYGLLDFFLASPICQTYRSSSYDRRFLGDRGTNRLDEGVGEC